MNVRCDICGRSYRNEAPILVGSVESGRLTMKEPDRDAGDYWQPACKCKPMTPRIENEDQGAPEVPQQTGEVGAH